MLKDHLINILVDPLVQLVAFVLPTRIMRSKRYFDVWQRHGYHVTPVHFYEPIPDTAALPDLIWRTEFSMPGVERNARDQLQLLRAFQDEYSSDYGTFPKTAATVGRNGFFLNNGYFISVDAELAYCMIRHFRPKRIIEIGCGYSSLLISAALARNTEVDPSYHYDYVAIEPNPRRELVSHCRISRLITAPVQHVGWEEFASLDENDILFIDATHVSRIGSDVNHLFFEVLPRLKSGVVIYFHDIFLPFEYPHDWIVHRNIFWNEQYLLLAFLTLNPHFRIVAGASYLHHSYREQLLAAFPSYKGTHSPGSFWLQRVTAAHQATAD